MTIVHLVISALLITLPGLGADAGYHCSHDQLMQCARPLSLLTESGLTFVASSTDLAKICPELKDALKCIHSYAGMCMPHYRKHFKQLFHGPGATVHELCDNATYQEEYLRYVPCMMQVADENQVCFDRYSTAMKEIQISPQETPADGQPMRHQGKEAVSISDALRDYHIRRRREAADEGIKNVCCTFQQYVYCSTHATRAACGVEAAEFSHNFLDRMSSSMIKMHCSEYGADECGLSSTSLPSCSSPSPPLLVAATAAALLIAGLRCRTITIT